MCSNRKKKKYYDLNGRNFCVNSPVTSKRNSSVLPKDWFFHWKIVHWNNENKNYEQSFEILICSLKTWKQRFLREDNKKWCFFFMENMYFDVIWFECVYCAVYVIIFVFFVFICFELVLFSIYCLFNYFTSGIFVLQWFCYSYYYCVYVWIRFQ